MPASVVKTAEDERDWQEAKSIAEVEGKVENWPYVMGIFNRISKTRKARELLQQSCILDQHGILRWKAGLDPVPISTMRRAGIIPTKSHIRLCQGFC